MGAGEAAEPRHGGAADAGEAAGLADAAAVRDVGEDGLGLAGGQAGVEQRGALALGEARLAGLAVEQPAPVGAVEAADGQVAVAALPGVGAIGVEAAEAAEVVVHDPPSRRA
jgi:hypothetical protein